MTDLHSCSTASERAPADWRPALPIILGIAAMLIAYAIVHDLITAHLCPAYFNQAHPDLGVPALFHATSPTVLGFAWGIAAGTGPGIAIGTIYAAAAQLGQRPRLDLRRLWPIMAGQLVAMGLLAAACGAGDY